MQFAQKHTFEQSPDRLKDEWAGVLMPHARDAMKQHKTAVVDTRRCMGIKKAPAAVLPGL